MKIQIKDTKYDIELNDLEEKTVKCLIKSIEKIGKCEGKIIGLYSNKTKIDKDATLEDSKITNDSTVLVLVRREQAENSGESKVKDAKATGNSTNPFSNLQNKDQQQANQPFGNLFDNPGVNPYMSGNTNPSLDMAGQLLKDPNVVEQVINKLYPNSSDDEKQSLKTMITQLIASNPNSLNAMLQGGMNPFVQGASPSNNKNQQIQSSSPFYGGMSSPFPHSPVMNPFPMQPYCPLYPYGYPQNFNGWNSYPPQMPPQMTPQVPQNSNICDHKYVNPEIAFKKQLEKLEELGFVNKELNVRILTKNSADFETSFNELFELSSMSNKKNSEDAPK